MKQVQHLFLVVLFSVFFIVIIKAQTTQLPNISSQYLTQGNDYGAVTLNIRYAENKSVWVFDGKELEFTQQNLYQFLDAKFEKLDEATIQQSNLKLEAPTDLPIHYFQDIYVWVQIYGNKTLHLAMYESMEPDKKKYLSLDVLIFAALKEACEHYAASTEGSNSAVETFSTIHPNTELLATEKKVTLSLTEKPIRPEHYIPQHILHIELNENKELIFKGRKVNPMVLGALIQSELATNYNNSYKKANPKQYLWLNLKMNKDVTYQQYAEVLVALQEAFHLYWEELAFNKFQKAYLDLDVQERWSIQQASPKLIAQYDAIELRYIQEKLASKTPQTWLELK
jgi:biopolymer transport protein ExbD